MTEATHNIWLSPKTISDLGFKIDQEVTIKIKCEPALTRSIVIDAMSKAIFEKILTTGDQVNNG